MSEEFERIKGTPMVFDDKVFKLLLNLNERLSALEESHKIDMAAMLVVKDKTDKEIAELKEKNVAIQKVLAKLDVNGQVLRSALLSITEEFREFLDEVPFKYSSEEYLLHKQESLRKLKA